MYQPPRNYPCLLLLLDDELLASITSWLSARELGRLAATCTRFDGNVASDNNDSNGRLAARSVVEAGAKVAVSRLPKVEAEGVLHHHSRQSNGEHGCGFSWLRVLRDLELMLAVPLEFTRCDPHCYATEVLPPTLATKAPCGSPMNNGGTILRSRGPCPSTSYAHVNGAGDSSDGPSESDEENSGEEPVNPLYRPALCAANVMKGGSKSAYYCEVTILSPGALQLGVARPRRCEIHTPHAHERNDFFGVGSHRGGIVHEGGEYCTVWPYLRLARRAPLAAFIAIKLSGFLDLWR